MERLARGIALEDITAITKISRHHLVALEQERFRLLPGGILSKGIVRGYVNVLGLNSDAWIERFLQASNSAGSVQEEEPDWEAFASNVGKARLQKREATETRVRWFGAVLLLGLVLLIGFLLIRYLGYRSGWYPAFLPGKTANHLLHGLQEHLHTFYDKVFAP